MIIGIINVLHQWNVNILQFKEKILSLLATVLLNQKKSGLGFGPVVGFL
jgi:hypothetical protein